MVFNGEAFLPEYKDYCGDIKCFDYYIIKTYVKDYLES